jgi:hypothetical protein
MEALAPPEIIAVETPPLRASPLGRLSDLLGTNHTPACFEEGPKNLVVRRQISTKAPGRPPTPGITPAKTPHGALQTRAGVILSSDSAPGGVILSAAVLQAERRISREHPAAKLHDSFQLGLELHFPATLRVKPG